MRSRGFATLTNRAGGVRCPQRSYVSLCSGGRSERDSYASKGACLHEVEEGWPYEWRRYLRTKSGAGLTTLKRRALAVAIALATLAVFAAEARAGSFAQGPPQAVLMKGSYVLQVRTFEAAHWYFYEDGRWVETYSDSFDFTYPKVDAVKAGRMLSVRLGKPQRPSAVGITAYPSPPLRAWSGAARR